MKKALKIILILFAVIVIIGGGGIIYISRGLDAGSKVEISAVAPTSLSDGTYNGAYTAGRWSNEVAVTIHEGKISDIEVMKDVRFASKEVSDEIFSRVVEAQNTTVDVVTDATVTSKAYLKSIENALTK